MCSCTKPWQQEQAHARTRWAIRHRAGEFAVRLEQLHAKDRSKLGEDGVTNHQKRLALVALVAVELAGAAFVLHRAFTLGDEKQPPGAGAAASVPAALTETVHDWVCEQKGKWTWTPSAAADLAIDWQKRPGSRLLAEIVLVPVARLPSLREQVASDELRRAWLGRSRPQDSVSRLFVSTETAAALDALFGPHADQDAVEILPANQVADRLWAEPEALAVVPFDQVEPRLTALPVDGLSALDRDLDLRRYPLLVPVWISGPEDQMAAMTANVQARGLDTNRHLDHLTVLVMTGVTALTRHLAVEMEARNDPGWPAHCLADLLSTADLTHVSNEVSFLPGCPAQAETTAFCARPEYLETLRLVGTDIVELTGNHNLDFGPGHALHSLDLYAKAGMHTFGGGRNAAEARHPLFMEHNDNRLAFLGYNSYGPAYAWATADGPGAARFALESVRADVTTARAQADLVFVSLQYTETYSTMPLASQVADFRAVVDAGADAVVGTQAHQPQAMEFYAGKPVFYGLGNLFFDQTWSEATCRSLVVRFFVYEGHLLAVQLIPTVARDDFQPCPATPEESTAILQEVYAASGW
jgi:hypothetical protein